MTEAHCAVGITGCRKDGHIPGGPLWLFTWNEKGYFPTMEDRVICGFFDTGGRWDGYGLGGDDEGDRPLPPLLQAVKDAIDKHLREHPEDVAGHLVYNPPPPRQLSSEERILSAAGNFDAGTYHLYGVNKNHAG